MTTIAMRILHHRATRRFTALLVGCSCGRKFLHRLDRPVVACLKCGGLDEVAAMIARLQADQGSSRRRLASAARRSRHAAA
jgi:hypothetical protein